MKFNLIDGKMNLIEPIETARQSMLKADAITTYLHDLKAEGFFMATFDKTPSDFFFGWAVDALKHGLHFILENDEAFLIIPAVALMFMTFFLGKNKTTKFIVPLWFSYFITSVLTETTGILSWLGK
jgi:hypothetical protein